MAFDFIKKYFPIKADSLDGFIEIVERERGVSVVAEPRIKAKMELLLQQLEQLLIMNIPQDSIRNSNRKTYCL